MEQQETSYNAMSNCFRNEEILHFSQHQENIDRLKSEDCLFSLDKLNLREN
jgi:hypothetical protein